VHFDDEINHDKGNVYVQGTYSLLYSVVYNNSITNRIAPPVFVLPTRLDTDVNGVPIYSRVPLTAAEVADNVPLTANDLTSFKSDFAKFCLEKPEYLPLISGPVGRCDIKDQHALILTSTVCPYTAEFLLLPPRSPITCHSQQTI
jgi:hypothetical protein